MKNTETSFTIYGVRNKKTGKLVSNITNPRHKFWESEARALSALDGGTAYDLYRCGKYDRNDLEVVKIHCSIEEKN